MATENDIVVVQDAITVDTTNESIKINIDNPTIKKNVDSKEPELYVNQKYNILPAYSYRSVDFTIPQSVIDTIDGNIDQVRSDLLQVVGDKEVAILDKMTYDFTDENGILKQQLIDLDTKYVSTGVIDEYVLINELSNQVIAKEYLIDRWTQGYIQDRTDWDVDFLHTDGNTYNNDQYLQARWAQPDIISAEADFPLSGLNGTLITDGGGGRVYRYTTDITSQDIYDKSVRVENQMASYTHQIDVFANNQTSYAQELTNLQTYAGEFAVSLDTLDVITAGMFHVWDGIEELKIGMIKFVGQVQYQYLGGTLGAEGDGWVRTDSSAIDAVDTLSTEIVNTIIPELQSQIDGAISTWFYDGSPEYSSDDTVPELLSTSTDTLNKLITGAHIFEISHKQMFEFLGADELNTDLTLENFLDTLRWKPIYKVVKPEGFWNAKDAGTTPELCSLSKDTFAQLLTNAIVYKVVEDQMYQFVGADELNTDLTLEDFSDTLRWTPVSHTKVTAERDNHLGDVYYDNITGFGYRFSKLDIDDVPDQGEIYTWVAITDEAALQALEAASLAQETADGKATVYYAASAPTLATHPDLSTGDIYVNSDTKISKIWNGSAWLSSTTDSAETAKGWAGSAAKFVGPVDANGKPSGPITGWSFGSSQAGAEFTSEFAISAEHFYLDSASDDKYRPFDVNATTGEITFRGNITFESVSGTPTHTVSASDPTGVAVKGSTHTNTTFPTTTWTYTDAGWVVNGITGAITQATLNPALADEQTVINGERIKTGSIVLNGLSLYTIPGNYSGTIIDQKGVRVYNNGVCRVKLGDLA